MIHPIVTAAAMPSNRTIRVATMHGLAAMLVLLFCLLFVPTHAQLQSQPEAISGNITTSPSCILHERDALLAFKNSITSDPAGLLNSWRRDGGHDELDCCRWRGVRCSNLTGHVHKLRLRGNYEEAAMAGKISSSLLALEHLEHLDLSQNRLDGSLPEFLGSLKSLKYLNLSGIPFYGEVPPQLGNLSKLQYLDLSSVGETYSFHGTYSTDLSWLTRLPSIQYLNLDGVNLSTIVDWPHVMNMLPSLTTLRLSSCHLVSANQSLPHLNLTNIEELDASYNYFNHPMVTSWFWNITSVKYLYLHSTGLYGQFPNVLGDMASLQVFDLSYYDYYYDDDDGQKMNMRMMTTVLMNLCKLEVLNLRSALLYGDITELLRNLPRCSPNKLRELDLSSNQLTGMLPRWIGQLTSLVVLKLNSNNITGPLPKSIGQLSGLKTLDLSCNNLNGNVPYEIGLLSNLSILDLNNNKLDGVIMKEHFASARSLKIIDLSYNALKIELSSDWKPTSSLDVVLFAACQMGPLFPGWLQWHVNITHLDISNAGIADKLPVWFADAFSNAEFLNISNNELNGGLPTNMGLMSSLGYLLLNSNQLTGQIPTLPPNVMALDLSNNFLTGPLPTANRYANLMVFSVFSNQITGHIPESFCKYHGLVVLDLSNNLLEGELPSCLGEIMSLSYLALSNNSFSGEFPLFVGNFFRVFFLDLSMNRFSGRLPMWIGNLMWLSILRLNDNKFFGNIPLNITNLPCLQYMDLHKNEISGSLPSHFSNLKAMRKRYMTVECYNDDIFYAKFISVPTVLKGRELNYGSISRVFSTNMMSIDLSSNSLTGEIPQEIIALDALVNLNVSRNHLSGVVPNKVGEMQSLESLDLSRNMLSGEIPSTLSNLTFLGYLDLSYNNLTGRIPSGPQLDTLYAAYPSMYVGNIGLCGHPLPNSCSSEGHAPKQGGLGRIQEGNRIQFFYLGLECGFVVGTWMAFGVLLFKRSWRIVCFRLSDKLCDKVYVLVVVWARHTRMDHDA